MSFVSNSGTRRVKRSCTHGTRFRSKEGGFSSSNVNDTRFDSGINSAARKKNSTMTNIGSSSSRGLTIIGGGEIIDYNVPLNPDNLDVPLGHQVSGNGLPESRLVNPPHPISFLGPGYLSFVNGFAVPYIIGSTEIKGNLIVSGTISAKNSFSSPENTFAPVITDGIGGTLTVASTQAFYKTTDFLDYFEMCVTWTDHSLAPNEPIRIEGLPLSTYSPYGFSPMVPDYGVYTINVGASIYGNVGAGTDYLVLTESDTTSTLLRQPVLGQQFEDAGALPGGGSFCMSGWLSKI